MEQVLDWLNENEIRSYPLLNQSNREISTGQGAFTIPDDFLLDLQLLILSLPKASDTNPLQYVVYGLTKLKKHAGNLQVSFGFKAEESVNNTPSTPVQGEVVTFEMASPSSCSYPFYIRDSLGNLAVFGKGAAAIAEALQEDIAFNVWCPVEQAACIQFDGAWLGVQKIKSNPEKKTEQQGYAPKLRLEDVDTQNYLIGDVIFRAGYNFRVAVVNSLIDLAIGRNYGLHMNCSTPFIAEKYLDCRELVSYINGVPPDNSGNFNMNQGANITILSGQAAGISDTHTLLVGMTFQSTDVCSPLNITPSLI
jgi:hypothetical protein